MRVSEDVMLASIVLDAVVRWGAPFSVEDQSTFADGSRCFIVRTGDLSFSMFEGSGEVPSVIDATRNGLCFASPEDLSLIDEAASDDRLARFGSRVHLRVIDGGS